MKAYDLPLNKNLLQILGEIAVPASVSIAAVERLQVHKELKKTTDDIIRLKIASTQ